MFPLPTRSRRCRAGNLPGTLFQNLKSQIVTSNWGGLRRAAPYAFTEQGVAMLSSVLNSGSSEFRVKEFSSEPRGIAATKSRSVSRKDAKAQRSDIAGDNHSQEFSSCPSKLGDFAPWRRNFRLSSFQIICIVRSNVFQKLFTPRPPCLCDAIPRPASQESLKTQINRRCL
jgi:hypothetical protein